MRIFNSLTRKVEEFVPINPPKVGMYTCGPTVYNYPTIGNWRTYVTSDLFLRAFKYLGYEVNFVMNLTDVGHLVSDADVGEDKLEKGARREGKTAWEVAKFYGDDFVTGFEKLNLIKPKIFCKATDHIKEQIALISEIEKKGLTYKTSDGVYLDVVSYEAAGNVYGELSDLDEIREGARVEINPEKRGSRDFALWKFSYPGGRSFDSAQDDIKRDMEWESPWGVGFPGWHIECSAMSMKYLGHRLDIHLGGEDLKPTHHPNEIAQSEAATGEKPFCNYWVHGAFLLIDGGRMGKSLGNAYTSHDIETRGVDLLALRYFYLTGHYHKQLNFTWEALSAANTALKSMKEKVLRFKEEKGRTQLSGEKLEKVDEFRQEFREAIEYDLNMPEALAVAWKVIKSNIPSPDKYDLLTNFDEVLGLGLAEFKDQEMEPNEELEELLEKRETLRREKKFVQADELRQRMEDLGYKIKDTESGAKLIKE